MDKPEDTILIRRNIYRVRRNIIRRFFLILLLIVTFYSAYKIYTIPTSKNLEIVVNNNHLTNSDFIVKEIESYISKKKFFFISPREISSDLIKSFSLIKTAVVRKYLIPEYKLIILIKEKPLWAECFSGLNKSFITEDGDVIPLTYLNINNTPKDLLSIYLSSKLMLPRSCFNYLRDAYEVIIKKTKIEIKKFQVSDKLSLEIYTANDIKINAGKINEELSNRVLRLGDVLKVLKEKSYLVEYLDLTLDNSVIFKKQVENKDKGEIPEAKTVKRKKRKD